MDTLDYPALLQLVLGHPADAVGGEVGVPGLDTPQAAEVLVALLLPLGDQGRVGDFLLGKSRLSRLNMKSSHLDTVVVELPGDGFTTVEQVENVSKQQGCTAATPEEKHDDSP